MPCADNDAHFSISRKLKLSLWRHVFLNKTRKLGPPTSYYAGGNLRLDLRQARIKQTLPARYVLEYATVNDDIPTSSTSRAGATSQRSCEFAQPMCARNIFFVRVAAGYTSPRPGHESLAAIAHFLKPDDLLFLYYRDRALMHARGRDGGSKWRATILRLRIRRLLVE